MISTQIHVIGVGYETELDDIIRERASARGMEPNQLRQRISDFGLPIGTWDQVYETLHFWEEVGFDRIYLPMWSQPWDEHQAKATFDALAKYS